MTHYVAVSFAKPKVFPCVPARGALCFRKAVIYIPGRLVFCGFKGIV